jgi:hypothetical protein
VSDELPEIFARLKPRPAPSELRARVLAGVESHLKRRAKPRWERAIELAVAASLVLGIGLNVWQVQSAEAWQLRVFGPEPIPTSVVEVAGMAASVTDPATGKLVEQRLLSARSAKRGDSEALRRRYEQLLHELTNEKVRSIL